jgi:hypothetical protein
MTRDTSHVFNTAPAPVGAQLSQFRRVVVIETPDHGEMIGCIAFNVKQLIYLLQSLLSDLRRKNGPNLGRICGDWGVLNTYSGAF